jgi:hypothetical protein
MNHTQALQMKAVEQYLLGELSEGVRDEFEDHFMGCAECAAEVKAGAIFVANAKEALRAESLPAAAAPQSSRPRTSWLDALFRPAIAAPALAVLLCVVGYESLVTIPRMESSLATANAPSSIASFSLLSGSSRGEASVPVVAKRELPFTLYVDVPPQPSFSLYTLDVENAAGALQFSLAVSADEARNTVQILVPAGRLIPGNYELVIRGRASQGTASQATEVGRSRFSLTYAN